MLRNMSFAMTTGQILNKTKTVTRRMGWGFLKPGDHVQPVKKCMGLKRGEKIETLNGPIRIVSVKQEKLGAMTEDLFYGIRECEKEGFPNMAPGQFMDVFCSAYSKCTPETMVTRIEFEYVEGDE